MRSQVTSSSAMLPLTEDSARPRAVTFFTLTVPLIVPAFSAAVDGGVGELDVARDRLRPLAVRPALASLMLPLMVSSWSPPLMSRTFMLPEIECSEDAGLLRHRDVERDVDVEVASVAAAQLFFVRIPGLDLGARAALDDVDGDEGEQRAGASSAIRRGRS